MHLKKNGLIIASIVGLSFLGEVYAYSDLEKNVALKEEMVNELKTENQYREYTAYKAQFPIYVDGVKWVTDKPVVVIEGSTYLPLKAIGDVLQVAVNWNDALKRVEITNEFIEQTINSVGKKEQTIKTEYKADEARFPIYINGTKWATDKPVVVIEGSTYLPLKSIGEVLNIEVSWNESFDLVEIIKNIEEDLEEEIWTYDENWERCYAKGWEEIIKNYDSYGIDSYAVNGLLGVKKDDKYGYLDREGNEKIPFIYEDAYYFYGKMARVKLNGKYGYIDLEGKTVIPFEYDELGHFTDIVNFTKGKKDGKWCYIDKEGNMIKEVGSYDYVWDIITETGYSIVKKDNKYGVIDINFNEVLPCIYEEHGYFFKDRPSAVKLDGKWGYINLSGETLIPFVYEDAFDFNNEGEAWVKSNGKWGTIDLEGNIVRDFISETYPDDAYQAGL